MYSTVILLRLIRYVQGQHRLRLHCITSILSSSYLLHRFYILMVPLTSATLPTLNHLTLSCLGNYIRMKIIVTDDESRVTAIFPVPIRPAFQDFKIWWLTDSQNRNMKQEVFYSIIMKMQDNSTKMNSPSHWNGMTSLSLKGNSRLVHLIVGKHIFSGFRVDSCWILYSRRYWHAIECFRNIFTTIIILDF